MPSFRSPSQGRSPTSGTAEVRGSDLVVRGDWTLAHFYSLKDLASRLSGAGTPAVVHLEALGRVDTSGASQLAELVGPKTLLEQLEFNAGLGSEKAALIRAVCDAMTGLDEPCPPQPNPVLLFLAQTGARVEAIYHLVVTLLGFMGQTLAALLWTLPRPRRWRMTPFVAAVHDTGLNALPIVALLTFLVGAVVAFLGATVLEDFGATIYTVDLVAFSFLREFGVLLAAILVAGRTASAFTAFIGSMKVNEELDAIRTFGLNPIELLVLPRVLAMIVSLPVLTFVGMVSGLVGGGLVCALSLDITPAQFIAIMERDIELRHFLVGMGKAPVFAFLVAVIGCLEGFKVRGSAQSVGEHTTSSVVQSIFAVILLDSIAALFFMEMGW